MFLRKAKYEALITRVAQLEACDRLQTVMLDDKQAELVALRDDLRTLMGLKPRLARAPQMKAEAEQLEPLPGSYPAQPEQQVMKLRETQRDMIARMQREADAEARKHDMSAVQAAITEYEKEVLK